MEEAIEGSLPVQIAQCKPECESPGFETRCTGLDTIYADSSGSQAKRFAAVCSK